VSLTARSIFSVWGKMLSNLAKNSSHKCHNT
jgi:hypothetical protein